MAPRGAILFMEVERHRKQNNADYTLNDQHQTSANGTIHLITAQQEAFMAKTKQRRKAMNHPKFTCNHINQKQLAERWDLYKRTLERWRVIGWGPLFLKIGGRVVYRVEDILAYEEQHQAESTQSRGCSR